jgi:hypothetical protein
LGDRGRGGVLHRIGHLKYAADGAVPAHHDGGAAVRFGRALGGHQRVGQLKSRGAKQLRPTHNDRVNGVVRGYDTSDAEAVQAGELAHRWQSTEAMGRRSR